MGVCTCVVEMVRLDAIGNQVGLLVVIMMGGPIRVKAKYSESISRARGFFLKAASIQETPATEINKKTSSSCQAHNTDAQNCYKNARKCPSELDFCCFWCRWWRLNYHAISVA